MTGAPKRWEIAEQETAIFDAGDSVWGNNTLFE